MLVCPSCGAENRHGARFCDACGSPLQEAGVARETRKVVTVLFCDVTGSTALGERIDPESLRRVMARYFETAKAIVERHGGTVEKFIGDAVMAVFGVPVVHEDDALRAVRAADELRGGLDELNDELERSYGTRLELRMGVNTGEVVTGTEERLATGDAVNVAARLEQAAAPGEILLGEETYRLVVGAVESDALEPVPAKGKAEPLRAYRLLSVDAEAPGRRHEAPMVGRERQRELLGNAFATVAGERSCHLFTILGPAGVGKSRLAEEFLRGLEGATVVRGRCLSYGEGITYWPVTEILKQLVGDSAEVEPALASILGDDSAASSPTEIAWAFRKLLESRASEGPLVVVFDDCHWGEPAFLDLVEHVADLSRGAPILLLCMARSELLDASPAWGGGKLNATNVLLEPLAREESELLLAELDDQIDPGLRARILEAAGGNPLFVEEMVAMAEDGGEIVVPPTIQALLAARLDQLEPGERGVLERGAVEGLVFHRGSVAALAPDEPTVDGRLITLVRKDLVRPEAPVFTDDEAFRFRHLLIRDTAYEALPKAVRAELHERFADWLEVHGTDLIELDEIVGYHLEQAFLYRTELGPLDDSAAAIGRRAAARLERSAERATERDDLTAAKRLLARALELMASDSPSRRSTQLELAVVLAEAGEFEDAEVLCAEVEAAARAAQDERLLARCRLTRLEAQVQGDQSATIQDAIETAREQLEVLERLGDEEGAVWALRQLAAFTAWLGKTDEALRLNEQALVRARGVSPRQVADVQRWILWQMWWGPTPVEEGIRRCEEVMAVSTSKRLEGIARLIRGALLAALDRLEEGRAEIAAGRGLLRDINDTIYWAGTSMVVAEAELSGDRGDPTIAYEALAEAREELAQIAETGYLSTMIGYFAQAACDLDREDEAEKLAFEAARLAQADDFEPHARSRLVRARVAVRRGQFDLADQLLREAGEFIEPTDYFIMHVDLRFAEAEVARMASDPKRARRALERARALGEAKGARATVTRADRLLAELA
jgi:class 3 adenylate cyclase